MLGAAFLLIKLIFTLYVIANGYFEATAIVHLFSEGSVRLSSVLPCRARYVSS